MAMTRAERARGVLKMEDLRPRRCEVDGCDEVYRARGRCVFHYKAWRDANWPVRCACGRAVVAKGCCNACYHKL